MTRRDADRFQACLVGLAEALGEPLSDRRIEAYFAALADLAIADLERAAARAIRECRWFPKPVELRAYVQGPGRTADEVAELAWTTVLQATRSRASWWESVRFDAPVMAAVVACWQTWPACCEALDHGVDDPALLAQRKAFLATVKAYLGHLDVRAPKYLAGYVEQQNRATLASWTHGWSALADQVVTYFPLDGPPALEPHPAPLALPEGTQKALAGEVEPMDPGPMLAELTAKLAAGTRRTVATTEATPCPPG